MSDIHTYFTGRDEIFVQQVKEWLEIFTNFETRNRYEILDSTSRRIGYMAETGSGFLKHLQRIFLRRNRPLEVVVTDEAGEVILKLKRPFFFFFSDLTVFDGEDKVIGHVKRRFNPVIKTYDILDDKERVFARVRSPIWRLWTFPVVGQLDNPLGEISKNWGGLLKEFMTDADRFRVKFGNLSTEQKAVVFATAISVDLDFFEENHNN